MNKFRTKIAQFMAGRHGMDQLSRALILLALLLIIASTWVGNHILSVLALAPLYFAYHRMLSRNHESRYRENAWYLSKVRNPIRDFIKRDRKNYTYFKCPGCGKTMRAPKGKGNIRVTCHDCGRVFEKKV